MPKTTSLITVLALTAALGSLCACGNSASPAPVSVSAAGQHPDGWLQQHYVAYKAQNGGKKEVSGATGCSECHGSDLNGGISKVSCFTASFNGMTCHANSDHTLGHPASWSDPTSGSFHALAQIGGGTLRGSSQGTIDASCGICHATGTAGTAAASAGPSCLNADASLYGISCHAASPARNSNSCLSCHGTPPDGLSPAGNARPNRSGSHDAHVSAGLGCAACHSTYGSGTSQHGKGFRNHSTAFLTFPATATTSYVAKGATGIAYSGGKCSAASCHGGKLTPVWGQGSITSCYDCHSDSRDSDQYNSYYSSYVSPGAFNPGTTGMDMHQVHLATPMPGATPARNIFCTDCHNIDALKANNLHFRGVGTPEMPDAYLTIGAGQTSIDSYTLNSGTGTYGCTNTCHPQVGLGTLPMYWR